MPVVGSATLKTSGEFTEEFTTVRLRDTYQVVTDSLNDTPAIVLAASGIPAYNAEHAADDRLKVRRRFPRRDDDNRLLWNIDVEYEGLRTGPDIPDLPDATGGMEWLPDVQWDGDSYAKEVYEDLGNKPIINKVGQRYDPPPSDEYADPVLTITRLQERYDVDVQVAFVGKVNADVFWGAEPGQCLCRRISAALTTVKDYLAWRVQYVFVFRIDAVGWRHRIAERATRIKDENGELRQIYYSDLGHTGKDKNEVVTEAVNLDSSTGKPLANQLETHWTIWTTKKSINFAPLNLDYSTIRQTWLEKTGTDIYGSYP